jgi:hypothetical protein
MAATNKSKAKPDMTKIVNPPTIATDYESLRLEAMATEVEYHGKDPLKKGYQLRHNLDGQYGWFPDYDNYPELHPV